MQNLRRELREVETPTQRENLNHPWTARRAEGLAVRPYFEKVFRDFSSWAESWKETLTSGRILSDGLAGITVAAVALPLNLALAVASGLPPASGIIAGAIGGGLAAIFGGSTFQVTGPAAALNVMVFAIVAQWGAAGAFAAAIAVGVGQLILYAFRAGNLMRFVPEAVLLGFVTGVGLKLLDQQIPLLLDVELGVTALIGTLGEPVWLREVHWLAVISGLLVISFMLGFSKYPKIPTAILGLALVTGVSTYLDWGIHRVGDIPAQLPVFGFPDLSWEGWGSVALASVPLAILAAAESLLSATAIDRMTANRKPHVSNLEIFGQGIANIGSGFFGGMPVSGVIVRSTVNVQSGGRTRLSSLLHAAILLVAPLVAYQWIANIPIAALAGLLCVVGYRLVEIRMPIHFFMESKTAFLAFILAATGVVTGYLTSGLLTALAISLAGEWVSSRARKRKIGRAARPDLPEGIRAKVGEVKRIDLFQRSQPIEFRPPEENWQAHVEHEPVIHPTAFVHPNASMIGHVVVGPLVHIASEAALRADEGTPFFVGAHSNIQDGVVIHALKRKWIEVSGQRWAVYIGERCSLAHQALVHGPCYIGEETFIGFKAVVHDSVVGKGCFIGIGAIVVGVEIPDGRFVPHGMLVDTAEKAQSLPLAAHHHGEFNDDVVEVNRGLNEAYRQEWLRNSIEIEPRAVVGAGRVF